MEEKMETENFNQDQERAEVKIGITRNGKSIIIRIPGIDRPFFKPVAYMKKVMESAEERQANAAVNIEKIKG